MIFDPSYLLYVFLPTLLLSLGAQLYVQSTYSKWSQRRNSAGLSGVQVAQRIFSRTNVAPVNLEGTPGELTDHYDPSHNVVRLSQSIATVPSVASMAVVAHELGHVQQHQEQSVLITMRNFLVPAVRFSPTLGYMMIVLGLMLQLTELFWLGIILFGLMVVFMILTLPVEIDASRRGLRLLQESGLIVSDEDISGSRSVLTAAALTYFAAAITAVLQLLYFISLANRRN
ncbi:MAG: zinc metallopeptidase [Aggregatilineales bacterium]